ncbi:protein of unknown function [Methylocaldum szegediense]|uniref:Uncharacterized protein n=1 Tax=Methylocaldum szegediense TaxID=73780 RepID=A0ABN8XAE6_9GAMM|nr:protein of unknown function [Methylocaldum szegediense]
MKTLHSRTLLLDGEFGESSASVVEMSALNMRFYTYIRSRSDIGRATSFRLRKVGDTMCENRQG